MLLIFGLDNIIMHTYTRTHALQKVILGVFFGVLIFNLCVSVKIHSCLDSDALFDHTHSIAM